MAAVVFLRMSGLFFLDAYKSPLVDRSAGSAAAEPRSSSFPVCLVSALHNIMLPHCYLPSVRLSWASGPPQIGQTKEAPTGHYPPC